MAALSLWQPILDAPFFREIASRLERGEKGLRLTGLVAGSRALVGVGFSCGLFRGEGTSFSSGL